MLSKDELLKYPNYLLTKFQLEIYRQVETYRLTNDLSKTDLAKKMGVSNPYVSQILNGNFNYTLKKLIEIGLTIGQVPQLSFIPVEAFKIESGNTNNQGGSHNDIPAEKSDLVSSQKEYGNTVTGDKQQMYVISEIKNAA